MQSENNSSVILKPHRLRLMVSSAVYGYQEFLDRIYDVLTNLGYEVWMSHKGTVPVTSDKDTIANCLKAVDDCDLFLGIITTHYGKTKRGEKSATQLEFERAVEKNKLRWFLVDDKVLFARNLLKHFYTDEKLNSRVDFGAFHFKSMDNFSDLRLFNLYDIATNKSGEPSNDGIAVEWVQEYGQADAALLFALAQFSRYQDLEQLLKARLKDQDYVRDHLL